MRKPAPADRLDSGQRRVQQVERAWRWERNGGSKERVYHASECRAMVSLSLMRSRRAGGRWWWAGSSVVLVVTLDLLRQA